MKDLYDHKYYKASDKFQRNTDRLDLFVKQIKKLKPKDVIDVGCGIGYLVRRLNEEDIFTVGIDFSKGLEEYWKDDPHFYNMDAKEIDFSDKSFDVVFSTDFFEHIEEKDIDKVASEMKRVGKKVIAYVADNIGEVLAGRQLRYHCTHKPLNWWIKKLEGIKVYSSHL